MKLEEIFAISGRPGLYKFVAQSKNGMIVESLIDRTRIPVQSTAKVSSLDNISVFTLAGDKPLSGIFQQMSEAFDGRESIDPKSSEEALRKAFMEAVPDYDRERVHTSDIKKIISWYNLLHESGMTQFTAAEEQPEEEAGDNGEAAEKL